SPPIIPIACATSWRSASRARLSQASRANPTRAPSVCTPLAESSCIEVLTPLPQQLSFAYISPMDDDLLELYSERLMTHGRRVAQDKRLDCPDITVHRRSPMCGSQVTLDIELDDQERVK